MLIDYLTDLVTNMESFRDDIATVYLYHHEGNLIATGNHPNRLIFYQVVPLHNLSDHLEAPAYLGALAYLRSLLGSSMMHQKEEPSIEISYKEKDGDKLCASSLRFVANKFESSFECTNPEILNEKDRVRQFQKPTDAITFSFTKEMQKNFNEVAKFNMPKTDTRLFTLAYDGNYVRAIFGNGKHTSNLILTNEVEGKPDLKLQKLLSLDRFKAMIKLTAENGGRVGYSQNAFWCDFDTVHAIHSIAMPTIREQNR